MAFTITDYIKYLESKKKEISNGNMKYAFSDTICDISDEIDSLREFYGLEDNILKR